MKLPRLTESERQAIAETIRGLAKQTDNPDHAQELTQWGETLAAGEAPSAGASTARATLASMGYRGPKQAS